MSQNKAFIHVCLLMLFHVLRRECIDLHCWTLYYEMGYSTL